MRRRLWIYVLVITAACFCGVFLSWSPLGYQFDLWAYDALLRWNPPPPRRSSAVILAIDEATLNSIGGLTHIREPLGQALQILSDREPAAIAIDIVLSEPRQEGETAALARALAQTDNVVLAANLRLAQDADHSWELPLAELRQHAAALGHVHAEPDPDGVCRRVLLEKAGGRRRLWALALEAFARTHGEGAILETPDRLQIGAAEIPASRRDHRELLIRFPHPAAPIERISLAELLERPNAAETARGRCVFVGVEVLGGLDRYLMTPYSFGAPMTGVAINAAVYETLAHRDFLSPLSPSFAAAASLLLAAWAGAAFTLRRTAWIWAGSLSALLAAHAAPWSFFRQDVIAPAAQFSFVAWACVLAGAAYRFLLIRLQLDRAVQRTSRYERAIHYVTHEMRTPLTAIQGSSELISRYSLPVEKQRQIGELIHRESQRLGKMIEMFLNVERLSSGQLRLESESLSADDVIAACIERITPLSARKKIEIRHQKDAGTRIWGDREFLEYACYNLISNAVKYSPAQTAVTVRAWTAGQRALVSVEDQGYGMDQADLKNIFRKFYRTSSAQRSGEGGSGLGLAIVEEIVVHHGGSIAVESQIGRGSKFVVTLPAGRRAARRSA